MDNNFSKMLGLRIRELRLAKGLKQDKLADMLDMERSNLTRIESGKQRPNDENILKLADIFNIEIKELFDFGHQKPKSELRKIINLMINDLSDKELKYIYKILKIMKEMN